MPHRIGTFVSRTTFARVNERGGRLLLFVTRSPVEALYLILSSRENPKICGIDDAEVVGDLIAVDMPIPRHLLA